MSRWTRRLLAMLSSATVLAVGLGVVQMLGNAASSAEPPQVIAQGADSGMAPERYIVELDDPPLARYRGGIAKLAPTAVREGQDVHLSVDSPAARAYLAYLDRSQELARASIRRVAPEARFDWRYRFVFNGFAVTLTADQAARVERLAGVRHLQREERLGPEMDGSAALIGAPEAYEQVGGIAEAGLGARIAVIDSGLDIAHPFLSSEGMPAAPEGYPTATMHLRDGTVVPYPEPQLYTSDKVIAARIFVSPSSLEGTEIVTALQQLTPVGQGHGLHVSGIAAGRDGDYEIGDSGQVVPLRLAGVAPMAQLLNYKANYAATPEYIAMLDQMVLDRVDVLNMSQGHVGWLIDRPETHPLAIAFDGAYDAGIVPVMSAGNAGSNGYTSLSGAFKYSDKVLAVGNSSSSGSFDVRLEFAGDGAPLSELAAAPRGVFTPNAPIAGPLFLAPEGGCIADPEAAGKIAVVDRLGQGTCGYAQRAQNMADSGALAAIFYYSDRAFGGASASAVALPSVAIGTRGGNEIMGWLSAGPMGAAATIDNRVRRGRSEAADIVSGSSSMGPGIDWTLKPDISAPGDGIISSYFQLVDGEVRPTFAALSGTSMSSPHVAGAAALLRSAHRDWSPGTIKSALVNTSSPSLMTGAGIDTVPAEVYLGGPGRLDLRQALDPGAVLEPTAASFGKMDKGERAQLLIALRSVSSEALTWTLAVAPFTGTAPVATPDTLLLDPGAAGTFSLVLDTAPSGFEESWGAVILTGVGAGGVEAAEHRLRLSYFAFIEDPAERKDVLLVNWVYGDTPDHAAYYTSTLETLSLTYDVWTIDEPAAGRPSRGHVPFKVLQRYDLVILNQNESIWAFQEALAGAYQYQNLLLHGGNVLVTGQGQMNWWRFLGKARNPDYDYYRLYCGDHWPFCLIGPSQNGGCDMCLPRYFAGFTFGVSATLSGKVLGPHEVPARPEREVVLQPHANADGPFAYALDLSTGSLAKDGAAGNQYDFASGDLLGPFVPSGPLAADGRDYDNTETVFDRVQPFARPLWSYTGVYTDADGAAEILTKTVGTYVAGKASVGSRIAWNAMFWGFGLEGVGKGAEPTQSRDRLLGDTFNLLARNLDPGTIAPRWLRGGGLTLDLPVTATIPLVARAVVDWGDGSPPEEVVPDVPVPADELVLFHPYSDEGAYTVRLDVVPAAHAAPLYDVTGEIHYLHPLKLVYLPVVLRGHTLIAPGPDEMPTPE